MKKDLKIWKECKATAIANLKTTAWARRWYNFRMAIRANASENVVKTAWGELEMAS